MQEKPNISIMMAFVSTLLMGVMGGLVLGLGAYVVSPIDVVPDVIPVAGQIDDGGAVIMMGALFYIMQKSGLLDKFMATWREASGTTKSIDQATEEVTE